MKSNLIRVYLSLFTTFVFVFALAFGASTVGAANSDNVQLAKNQAAPRVDDAPKPHPPHKLLDNGVMADMTLAKGKAPRVDDNPKPHGPTHKLINDNNDNMVFAKNQANKAKNAPKAPAIDAPIKNAPHAPGAVHG